MYQRTVETFDPEAAHHAGGGTTGTTVGSNFTSSVTYTKCLRVTLTTVHTVAVQFPHVGTHSDLWAGPQGHSWSHTYIYIDCEKKQGTATMNKQKKHTRAMCTTLRGRQASRTILFFPAYTIRHPDTANAQLIKREPINTQQAKQQSS